MPATLADIQAKYGEGTIPRYKGYEPYMESPTGHGYQGVVLYDTKNDLVLCSECGKKFKSLSNHLRLVHGMNTNEYKEKHGLFKKTPLVNKATSVKYSQRSINNWKTGKTLVGKENVDKHIPDDQKLIIEAARRAKIGKNSGKRKRQFQNSQSLCPEQIVGLLTDIKIQVGKDQITSSDVYKCNKNLYSVLARKFGGVESFCVKLGIEPSKYETTDHNLVANLRKWVIKHKKIPSSFEYNEDKYSDIPKGLGYHACKSYFGSWRKAKTMAGLDQLLQEIQSDPHKGIPAHLIVGGRPNE